jgi:hypothetical protein
VAWKPKVYWPPAAMTRFQSALLLVVTAWPVWLQLAFQRLVMRWLPGKVQVRVQPLKGLAPVFVMVRLATKPSCHWDWMA